ncbi:hypothetical protein HAX54_022517, partial [Datura stramonium]|nr:hypothetical protein [Datura stramonium]
PSKEIRGGERVGLIVLFGLTLKKKVCTEGRIDEGRLALEFRSIRDKIRELGASYIFNGWADCNLLV